MSAYLRRRGRENQPVGGVGSFCLVLRLVAISYESRSSSVARSTSNASSR